MDIEDRFVDKFGEPDTDSLEDTYSNVFCRYRCYNSASKCKYFGDIDNRYYRLVLYYYKVERLCTFCQNGLNGDVYSFILERRAGAYQTLGWEKRGKEEIIDAFAMFGGDLTDKINEVELGLI